MRRALAITGILFLVAPLLLVLWTVIQYFVLKSQIHHVEEQFARASIVLMAFQLQGGVCTGFVGMILLGLCVDGQGYRPRWLLWWMISLGVLWLLYFPLGSTLGLALLIYTASKRKKFGVVR
ncbi:hypothetical protein DES53_101337 [Roseimicrobium gellanilyticum]|uniref:Uncharacterized protein n=1 Tax=Roseimicrobium gellanilyticum TaxID=748857 RepID=A0A366HUL2_9BACT|nr:hypothetical protein [Roseimicrobium gellanilyticum]RBP47540.1 hypothetical protein DES53_101337 [Roseimicrobium gellanilyticum]